MIRVFGIAFGGDELPFGTLGWASIAGRDRGVTMTIGNIAALRQDNIKRMLAYSSISHAGVPARRRVRDGPRLARAREPSSSTT